MHWPLQIHLIHSHSHHTHTADVDIFPIRTIANVRFFKPYSTPTPSVTRTEHGGQHHGHSHGLSNSSHQHTKLTQLTAGSQSDANGIGGSGANSAAIVGGNVSNHSNSTDDNENNSFMQQRPLPEPIKPTAVATSAAAKKAKSAGGHGHSHGGHGHSHGGGGGGAGISDRNMNMRGVYLHVLSDALGSIIVVISALVVWLTEWKYKYYMDPALSVLLVALMLRSVWPLLRESALILLQTVPTHIQVSVATSTRGLHAQWHYDDSDDDAHAPLVMNIT